MVAGSTNKPSILITEDDTENQKFLQLLLSKDFDVAVCDSEESFFENLKSKKFDLILMDISLKGKKNGLDLTREVKEHPDFKDIPVICLSAHAFKQDRDNAIDAGVDAFLTKPIENSLLLSTLKNLMNK